MLDIKHYCGTIAGIRRHEATKDKLAQQSKHMSRLSHILT